MVTEPQQFGSQQRGSGATLVDVHEANVKSHLPRSLNNDPFKSKSVLEKHNKKVFIKCIYIYESYF
jgi:hypothetical protein